MATNKNALIRYKTIDKCLQNRSRYWTLKDLIEACSDALYEYEGKHSLVSKRTTQLDIQTMRSNKLGYNAPIIVQRRKYYTYEDENYSITNIPITQLDLAILSESMEVLSQFKDFSLFSDLNGVIQKLEDKVYRESGQKDSIIHLEKNEHLVGLNHLDTIYQAILKRVVLQFTYQSFKARSSSQFLFHCYILKEFNNRWFVIGKKNNQDKIFTLALDRILKLDVELDTEYNRQHFDPDMYYQNTYGVTVLNESEIINIVLKINRSNAPYVLTKPFHHSQELVQRHEDGAVTVSLRVHHNFEIERLILGFADSIEVLKPRKLRSRIKKKFKQALANY